MNNSTLFSIDGPEWSLIPPDAPERAALKSDPKAAALGASAICTYRPLPFYAKHGLYRLRASNGSSDTLGLFLVSDGTTTFHLDGTSPPIHNLNAKAPIQLSEETALSYLAFFCFFVRGEDGPFWVIDNLENRMLPDYLLQNDPKHKTASDEIRRLYRPPELFGTDDTGNIRASAMIYYSDAVFVSDFLLFMDGKLEMLDDEPLLSGLPGKVKAQLD
jgi:hypothetical protein